MRLALALLCSFVASAHADVSPRPVCVMVLRVTGHPERDYVADTGTCTELRRRARERNWGLNSNKYQFVVIPYGKGR